MATHAQPPRELPRFLDEFAPAAPRALAPFLDEFRADGEAILFKNVTFPSAAGPVHAYWARPDRPDRLPAVLLVYGDNAWTEWMNTNARQLASIGYEVVAVNVHRRQVAADPLAGAAFTDEPTLAELSGAVRWLRRRSDILPGRLGVVGWGWGGGQALALASALPLQACVVCDAPLPEDPDLIAGLRGTPLLGIFGGAVRAGREHRERFQKFLARHAVPCKLHLPAGVAAGFMGPPSAKAYAHDAAEDAWVAIYNFLEKHVEDARTPGVVAQPTVATVADLMRAVNTPAGLRGALSQSLEQKPASAKEWAHVRAQAALIAEAGGWLRARTPVKGPAAHWDEQAAAFIAAASAIVDAADRRDHAAAQQGLARLAAQCAACHAEHR